MKKLIVALLIALTLVLIATSSVFGADPNPVRSMPASVAPGQTFDVTVTFTSPANNFNSLAIE